MGLDFARKLWPYLQSGILSSAKGSLDINVVGFAFRRPCSDFLQGNSTVEIKKSRKGIKAQNAHNEALQQQNCVKVSDTHIY